MQNVIDLWLSVPESYRGQFIWKISFVIPIFLIVIIRPKWIAIITGTLACIIPSELDFYALCSRKMVLCNAESYEIGPIIIALLIAFVYCLFILFLYLSIKNLFRKLFRHLRN